MITKKISGSAKAKQTLVNTIVHIFLSVLSVIWLFPVFWIVLLSFREQKGQYIKSFWPDALTLDNYRKLFFETDVFNFPRWFMNTLIVSVFSCLITTFFVLAVSYSMSRLRFKMRKPFLNIALVMGMFPGFFAMIAVYYILKALGLTEGPRIYLALIMAYSGSAGLGFYISKGFFDTIPKALDEAAMIDGATRWQIFTKITIPLSKPIVVYTLLGAFMAPWLDFVFAKVIVGPSQDYYTVAIGLYAMLTKENILNWYTAFAAGAVCVSIPIAIVFLYLQRFYAEGMSGAVKG
ncbi:MAG: sugar ABC transporter permease [Eubacteriales bacterium]|nr:sugar ABC transporter permease [Eubacteriales bacterium]